MQDRWNLVLKTVSALTSKSFGFSLVYRRKWVLTSFGDHGNILRGLSTVPAHGESSLKQPSLGKQTSFPAITQKCVKNISLTTVLFLNGPFAKIGVKLHFVAYFLPAYPQTSSYLHTHRTALIGKHPS